MVCGFLFERQHLLILQWNSECFPLQNNLFQETFFFIKHSFPRESCFSFWLRISESCINQRACLFSLTRKCGFPSSPLTPPPSQVETILLVVPQSYITDFRNGLGKQDQMLNYNKMFGILLRNYQGQTIQASCSHAGII